MNRSCHCVVIVVDVIVVFVDELQRYGRIQKFGTDRQTDRQTDKQTNRQTDTTMYRVAPQLKTI